MIKVINSKYQFSKLSFRIYVVQKKINLCFRLREEAIKLGMENGDAYYLNKIRNYYRLQIKLLSERLQYE